LTCVGRVNAQTLSETFFPTKQGVSLLYNSYDNKGKLTGIVRYIIKDVVVNGADMDITYICESFSPKNELLLKDEITINQRGDKLFFDMSNFLNKNAYAKDGEMTAEIEIKGNSMEIPLNPNPGDKLRDANVEMIIKMGFNMKISVEMTNRTIESIDNITVKAGAFDTYKLTCDIKSVAMGMKSQSKMVEWYAKGIGTIKQETYDQKGKLMSSMELVEVKGL
jgi:hypothetical protein